MNDTKPVASDGIGCVSLIVTILVVWALIFGISWGGKHYEMDCSCDRGLAIDVK